MKREILFRAKAVHDLQWVYGNFIHSKRFAGCGNEFRIHNQDTGLESDIIPETVGQFTGLVDKNGVEIFERDTLKCTYFKMALGEGLGAQEIDAEIIGSVGFDGLSLCLQEIISERWEEYTGYAKREGDCRFALLHDVYEGSQDAEMGIEIIGNIHDNPELLS